MKIYSIEYVQIAMPSGEEEQARAFYSLVLGIPEVPKPANIARHGGVWFEVGTLKIQLGIEKDFRPALKAHPALLVEGLDEAIKRCERAGYEVIGEPLENYHHVYSDPI